MSMMPSMVKAIQENRLTQALNIVETV